MTITQALRRAAARLEKSCPDSPLLDAQILLAQVLNYRREELYINSNKPLTSGQRRRFDNLIAKRASGEPVAYLTGNKEFFGLNFYVNKNVLIPRPATELLVRECLKVINRHKIKTAADIGCGSGAIAIALAKQTTFSAGKIWAVDISKRALAAARQNAVRHQVKINFRQGDLLEPLKNLPIELIVANLPYLSQPAATPGPLTIGLDFEPARALYGGRRGLAVYEKFWQQLKKRPQLPKFAIIEIDPAQAQALSLLIKQLFPRARITRLKDWDGSRRALKIKF